MPRRPLAFVSCALVQSSTTPQSATYLAIPRSRNDIAAEIPRAAKAPPRSIEKKKLIGNAEADDCVLPAGRHASLLPWRFSVTVLFHKAGSIQYLGYGLQRSH